MSAFFFGQVSHHTPDRNTKILSFSLNIGLDFSGLSGHVNALNRRAVLYSLRQMMISSTDTTGIPKSAFLRHSVNACTFTIINIHTHMGLESQVPICVHTVEADHHSVSCKRHCPKGRSLFFFFSNSLHSFLAARSIYSKYSEMIPMASRNGLLHIVSPQKSPSVQEHGLHLVIQMIQGNLSNFPVAQYMWTPQCLSSHAPPPT